MLKTKDRLVEHKDALVQARLEPSIKKSAETILRRVGLSPTEAIRVFYQQISLRRGLPFAVEIPNEVTAETLNKTDKGEEVTWHDNPDTVIESILAGSKKRNK